MEDSKQSAEPGAPVLGCSCQRAGRPRQAGKTFAHASMATHVHVLSRHAVALERLHAAGQQLLGDQAVEARDHHGVLGVGPGSDGAHELAGEHVHLAAAQSPLGDRCGGCGANRCGIALGIGAQGWSAPAHSESPDRQRLAPCWGADRIGARAAIRGPPAGALARVVWAC
jgi:hypothetical protein